MTHDDERDYDEEQANRAEMDEARREAEAQTEADRVANATGAAQYRRSAAVLRMQANKMIQDADFLDSRAAEIEAEGEVDHNHADGGEAFCEACGVQEAFERDRDDEPVFGTDEEQDR